jgi:hypothetical protein
MSVEARTRRDGPTKGVTGKVRSGPLLVCGFPRWGFRGGNPKLGSREIIVKTSFLMLNLPNKTQPSATNDCRRLTEFLVF